MVTLTIDMHALISSLPASEQEAALEALLSCDTEQVYRFLRSKLDPTRKMMLDMAWRLVSQEQREMLNDLLQRGVDQEFNRTELTANGTVQTHR